MRLSALNGLLDMPWRHAGFNYPGDDPVQQVFVAIRLSRPHGTDQVFDMRRGFDPGVTICDIAFVLYERVLARVKHTGGIVRKSFVQRGYANKDNLRNLAVIRQDARAKRDEKQVLSFRAGRNKKGTPRVDHAANAALTRLCVSRRAASLWAVSSVNPVALNTSRYEIGRLEPSGSFHSGSLSCV